MALVSVVFPLPLHRVFSYLLPDDGPPPLPGSRVLAPLGRRRAVGFVVDPVGSPPAGVAPRSILAALDREPLFTPSLWELAQWIAAYYVAPLGVVLKAMLPPGLLRVRPSRVAVASGGKEHELEALSRRGPARRVPRVGPGSPPAFLAPRGEADHPLTEDQRLALTALRRRLGTATPETPPRPVLLHGVTGSGKTLVYLKLVEAALGREGNAIVLVPEIGLTPRAAARFREAFGDRVALLHSALSEGERWAAWRAMHEGEVRVAVGPRSAVFAPFPSVAVLVVDEEHEASYKQEESPRYNAREVAIMRARLEGALVVLGSATPSLESYANAEGGKYVGISLPRRVAERALPRVEIVDMRARGPDERILSRPLREALTAALERGEQALLFMNRRGFSLFLQCRDCGAVPRCPECRITLTLHRRRGGRGAAGAQGARGARGGGGFVLCHYCDHREAAPDLCPACGGLAVAGKGFGTQQVEELVSELFPRARIARMDHDTTSRKGSHGRIVEAMERGEVHVLVGTQMVAKGHDFPGLTLVGVVSADTGLNFPDFRAAERTFQLVTQVAGRPGRGSAPGRVLVQSHVPDHPAIVAAARHDYEAFYRSEMADRVEVGYPPAVKLASCLLVGADEERVTGAARSLAATVAAFAGKRDAGERLSCVGPSPAPLAQLRRKHRWRLLLKSTSPSLLESALHDLAARWEPPRGVQLAIDRDPYDLL